jgi:hypothetical protein
LNANMTIKSLSLDSMLRLRTHVGTILGSQDVRICRTIVVGIVVSPILCPHVFLTVKSSQLDAFELY